MAEPTVSAGYANALIDLAVAKGADQRLLMEHSQIDTDDLADPDHRISFDKFKRLMRAGKALSNEPALALHFGEAFGFEELSIVGLVCHAAETMAEAFAQMNRYGRLVIEVDGVGAEDRFQIIQDDDGVWIDDTRKNPNSFPELTESTLGRFICGVRRYFPNAPFVLEAHVTHAQPDHVAEYERILNVPIVFNSVKNAMRVDPSSLTKKLPHPNRYVFGIFSEHAEALLDNLESSKTIRGKVESMLIPVLHKGDISMKVIAQKMGLSRQTLYRKLKTEGISYEKLLDELRHQMAQHYLRGEKVSVNETAYLVGFSDPSAFSRAFKRWTGNSPSVIRSAKSG